MKVKVDGVSSMMAPTARTRRWHFGLMKQLVLAHDQVGWLRIIHVATQAPHLENRSPIIQFRCLFDVAFATGLAFVDTAPDQGRGNGQPRAVSEQTTHRTLAVQSWSERALPLRIGSRNVTKSDFALRELLHGRVKREE
jgi:hypothetical protein